MTSPLSDLHLQTITFLLQTGQKDQAIKYYADITNATSFQAKDAIKGLEQSLLVETQQPPTQPDLSTDISLIQAPDPVWAEVDKYIQQDQLIQAIKIYRTITGTDLKTSKQAVENRRDTYFSQQNAQISRATSSQNPETVWEVVDQCLRADRKIEALKAYRTIMNVELKEAVEKVNERALSVKPDLSDTIKSHKVPTSGTDKLRVLLFWLIILGICYYLMSDFIQSITLVGVIVFFIQLFSF